MANEAIGASNSFEMQQRATSNGRTPSQNIAELNSYLSQQLPPIEHQQAHQQPASSAENESYGVERNVQKNNYRIDDNTPPQLLERNVHNCPSIDQPQANKWNGENNGNRFYHSVWQRWRHSTPTLIPRFQAATKKQKITRFDNTSI